MAYRRRRIGKRRKFRRSRKSFKRRYNKRRGMKSFKRKLFNILETKQFVRYFTNEGTLGYLAPGFDATFNDNDMDFYWTTMINDTLTGIAKGTSSKTRNGDSIWVKRFNMTFFLEVTDKTYIKYNKGYIRT